MDIRAGEPVEIDFVDLPISGGIGFERRVVVPFRVQHISFLAKGEGAFDSGGAGTGEYSIEDPACSRKVLGRRFA